MGASLGIVVNLRARRFRRDGAAVDRLTAAAGPHAIVRASSDDLSLARAIRDLASESVRVIALAGGDGTCGRTISAMVRAYPAGALPAVALLGGGTMNTIPRCAKDAARELGYRGTPWPLGSMKGVVERTARAANAASRDEPLPIARLSSLRVEGEIGFLFGMGVSRAFLDAYYARSARPTGWTAALTLADFAREAVAGRSGSMADARMLTRERWALEIDGEAFPASDYLGLFAGTVPSVGLGFDPLYLARGGTRGFHVLALHGRASLVAQRLPRAYRGRPMGADCARDWLARRLTVRADDARAHGYFLDGDLRESKAMVNVELGPELSFLAV